MCRSTVDIRLVDEHVVDVNAAVAKLDRVTRLADDALDVRRGRRILRVLDRVGARALADDRREYDDVAARVRVEAGRQLVDEHVLVGQERRLHALLLDPVGLGNEGLDEPEDDDGQDEGLGDLDETAQWLPAHRRRSVVGPAVLGRGRGPGLCRRRHLGRVVLLCYTPAASGSGIFALTGAVFMSDHGLTSWTKQRVYSHAPVVDRRPGRPFEA